MATAAVVRKRVAREDVPACGHHSPEEAVVTANLPLVRFIATRIAASLPIRVELDDLVQTGTLGLIDAVRRAGLDTDRARQILAGHEFEAETRAHEQKYLGLGIHSVPSLILNDKYLLEGAQPTESFEQALRQLAVAQ